jgi:hypothetical protein
MRKSKKYSNRKHWCKKIEQIAYSIAKKQHTAEKKLIAKEQHYLAKGEENAE